MVRTPAMHPNQAKFRSLPVLQIYCIRIDFGEKALVDEIFSSKPEILGIALVRPGSPPVDSYPANS